MKQKERKKGGREGRKEGHHEKKREKETLHCNAHNHVRPVPKAHVASIASRRRWIPRHDDEEQVRRDVEHHRDVPRAELGPSQSQPAATVSDNVQARGQEEEEDGGGVRLQVDD